MSKRDRIARLVFCITIMMLVFVREPIRKKVEIWMIGDGVNNYPEVVCPEIIITGRTKRSTASRYLGIGLGATWDPRVISSSIENFNNEDIYVDTTEYRFGDIEFAYPRISLRIWTKTSIIREQLEKRPGEVHAMDDVVKEMLLWRAPGQEALRVQALWRDFAGNIRARDGQGNQHVVQLGAR